MTNFLDKVAMEVSEWGKGSTKDPMRWVALHPPEDGEIRKSPLGWLAFNEDGDKVLVRQWIQRRKELINEPCDSDAPEWANWKAQDSCGKWFWHKTKPIEGDSFWDDDDGWRGSNKGKIPAGHDWRDTLKEVKREPKVYDSFGKAVNDLKLLGLLKGVTTDNKHDEHICGAQKPSPLKTILKLVEAFNDCIDDEVSEHLRKTIIRLLDKL